MSLTRISLAGALKMEVAQTGTLKSTGDVKFNHSGTHSSLAEVDHTAEGLAA
jgi:hypothetical protein